MWGTAGALDVLRLEIVEDIPWLLPGLLVTLALSLIVARPVARWLGTSDGIGWLVVMGLGAVVAATLTPIDPVGGTEQTCDLSRFGLAPFRELRRINDTSLNVALFVPLGMAVGLLPNGRRRWIALGLAVLLPAGIEAAQWLAPWLGRGCQSADIVDNATGLVVGLMAAGALRVVAGAVRRRPEMR